MANLVSVEVIAPKILLIRGKKVMLDRDLAFLYGIKAIALRQQVKRNKERFPKDFMFQLTKEESRAMVSQNVIPSLRSLGGNVPYVFTQEGVAMLSSVLNSRQAILVNIQIMRAFAQFRRMLLTNVDLKKKIEDLENKYDKQFAIVFQAIKALLEPPEKPRRRIGFHV